MYRTYCSGWEPVTGGGCERPPEFAYVSESVRQVHTVQCTHSRDDHDVQMIEGNRMKAIRRKYNEGHQSFWKSNEDLQTFGKNIEGHQIFGMQKNCIFLNNGRPYFEVNQTFKK